MRAHVVLANDLTIAAPNIGHVAPLFALEAPVNIEWAMWTNDGKHKIAQGVTHMGSAIAQAFHDCGRLIPHLNPLDIGMGPLGSSREIMFSAMDVTVENEPIGFAEIRLPMLTCGMIPMPVGLAPGSMANDVLVGLDPLWDVAVCWFGTLVEMVVVGTINVVLFLPSLAAPGAGTLAKEAAKSVGLFVAGYALQELVGLLSPGQSTIESLRERRSSPSSWDEI